MKFELSKCISILERTPEILDNLLLDLSEEWTSSNEGAGTWSIFDIVGHFIHGEKTDWIVRATLILSNNKVKNFQPFDRYAQFNNSEGKSIEELLKEFKELRQINLKKLMAFKISDEDLKEVGIHPEFGEVSLEQLLASWVAHDLGHIAQITRVMAKQYKNECGPWMKYLGIRKA